MNIGNRFAEKVIAVYFFALTVMMYYFLDNTLNFKLSITFQAPVRAYHHCVGACLLYD